MPYTGNEIYRIAVAEEPEILLETMETLTVDNEQEETETADVDYTIYLEDIISNQQAIILYQIDTINALNVNQKKQEQVQGFTASIIIGLFVIILIGGACKYLKSIF